VILWDGGGDAYITHKISGCGLLNDNHS